MAGAYHETRRRLCWEKNTEICSWKKKERPTKKMLGRLHKGGPVKSGDERKRRVGQEQVEMQDPHW